MSCPDRCRGGPMPLDPLWPPTEPLDAEVSAGKARLAVDLRGGGLRELVVGNWEVLDGSPSGTVPAARRGGVLLPWPNRLRGGRWTWQRRDLPLVVGRPGSPAAVHAVAGT